MTTPQPGTMQTIIHDHDYIFSFGLVMMTAFLASSLSSAGLLKELVLLNIFVAVALVWMLCVYVNRCVQSSSFPVVFLVASLCRIVVHLGFTQKLIHSLWVFPESSGVHLLFVSQPMTVLLFVLAVAMVALQILCGGKIRFWLLYISSTHHGIIIAGKFFFVESLVNMVLIGINCFAALAMVAKTGELCTVMAQWSQIISFALLPYLLAVVAFYFFTKHHARAFSCENQT
ncbi:MAG: hypothetical protein ACD_39C01497G0007 [uncultured bacterium]|nr:MAG: hypothetical protein ACD_39C01497G0007 [uncultured bacterium]